MVHMFCFDSRTNILYKKQLVEIEAQKPADISKDCGKKNAKRSIVGKLSTLSYYKLNISAPIGR